MKELASITQKNNNSNYEKKKKKKMKESEKNCQILGSSPRTKKSVEHEGDRYSNCSWCSWNGPQKFEINTIQITVLLKSA